MNKAAHSVQNMIHGAWSVVSQAVQAMYSASAIRPQQAVDVFRLDASAPDDEVKFIINPIVFNLPERATRQDANLYVVLSGWLSFEGDFKSVPLRTRTYGTEVGYFRTKRQDIYHVYGAHYDLDEKAGHPVFHAQIGSQVGFVAAVNSHFHKKFESPTDHVTHLLPNVRTPSAQMDVFSVITQLCADHLFDGSPTAINSFSKMRNATQFFWGAAHRMTQLQSAPASCCYRSTHWYP
jgi:hypothetical protein